LITVSIPIWYGLNVSSYIFFSPIRKVSIPIWYGLNLRDKKGIREELNCFNSNMVRLKFDVCPA